MSQSGFYSAHLTTSISVLSALKLGLEQWVVKLAFSHYSLSLSCMGLTDFLCREFFAFLAAQTALLQGSKRRL